MLKSILDRFVPQNTLENKLSSKKSSSSARQSLQGSQLANNSRVRDSLTYSTLSVETGQRLGPPSKKLKEAITSIDALNAKIADTDRAVKSANQQQRVDDIKNKIADLKKKLDAANAKIKDVEPAFNDLQASYDDLAKVRESNFNGCYKTIFNDDSSEFKQDDNDDQIQFDGAETFNRYCQKVFGDAASPKSNIRVVDNAQKADKPADQPVNGAGKQPIKITRTNVFSAEWKNSYGDALEDDTGDVDAGHKFDQEDFQCDVNN